MDNDDTYGFIMDKKQEEQLKILLKARKRAEKVLAERKAAEQKKLEEKQHKQATQEKLKQYGRELTEKAQECGMMAAAEQAAKERNGELKKQVSYYMDYGLSTSNLHRALNIPEYGELRASHLSLRIIWNQADAWKEAEIRVYYSGQVTFHNFILPVFPFIWRRKPEWLRRLLLRALQNPRPTTQPAQSNQRIPKAN